MKRDYHITFIGAGNLATQLAKAFYRKGFVIDQIYSRTANSAQSLAYEVEAQNTTVLEEIILTSDLYIIALQDDTLVKLLPRILSGKENALIVHTAGSVPSSIFEGQTNRYGVFYPMQTFSKEREVDFSTIPLFIEANLDSDKQTLLDIASILSNKVFEADSEQRKKLHLAAVFSCNFVNHMYALSAEILERYGLPFDSMLSLIDETTRKIHEVSPKEAQTGPAIRNDQDVMNRHLSMLAPYPDVQEVYRLVSKNILKHKSN